MSHERSEIVSLVNAAREAGARQSAACEIIGISAKTFQRWNLSGNASDGRLHATHEPPNKLTTLERQRIIRVANAPEHADLPPGQIVPKERARNKLLFYLNRIS